MTIQITHDRGKAMRRTRQSPSPSRGMTLIELVTTLGVASILLTVGVPSFRAITEANTLSGTANQALTGLNIAKSEAIRRNDSIRFCVNETTREWKILDLSDVTLQNGSYSTKVTLTQNNLDTTSVSDNACVRFRPNGLSYTDPNALLTNGEIIVTIGSRSRTVHIKTGALNVTSS